MSLAAATVAAAAQGTARQLSLIDSAAGYLMSLVVPHLQLFMSSTRHSSPSTHPLQPPFGSLHPQGIGPVGGGEARVADVLIGQPESGHTDRSPVPSLLVSTANIQSWLLLVTWMPSIFRDVKEMNIKFLLAPLCERRELGPRGVFARRHRLGDAVLRSVGELVQQLGPGQSA